MTRRMLVAGAALAFAAAATALVHRSTPPSPALRGTIGVVAGRVEFLPPLAPRDREIATASLAAFIRRLYERAFLVRPEPSPGPGPAARLADLVSPQAERALTSGGAPFDPGPGLRVERGTLVFDGFAVHGGGHASAYLAVRLRARARPDGGRAGFLDLNQKGTLLLEKGAGGWVLEAFHLTVAVQPVPNPSP